MGNLKINLVLSFVILGFAMAKEGKIEMTNDQLARYIQECLTDARLPADIQRSNDRQDHEKFISQVKKSCFMACMYKKAGIMQEDGRVRTAQDEIDETIKEATRKCAEEAGSNVCKLAWCLHRTDAYSIPIVPQHVAL